MKAIATWLIVGGLVVAGGSMHGGDTRAASAGEPPAQTASRSTNAGVYTEVQARRGEEAFDTHCGSCHEPDRFKGSAFVDNWQGPLDNLFTTIRKSMPEDNPGGLAPQAYADVIAYLLNLNGYTPGPDRLEGTLDAMRSVILEPTAHATSSAASDR